MIRETLRFLDPNYRELENDMQKLNMTRLPLMDGPMTLLIILSVYLVFVLWFGPKYMESRPAYNLHKFIIIYNISQILLNFWATWEFSGKGFVRTDGILDTVFKVSGKRRQPVTQVDANLSVVLLASRIWDLMDTVFLILRKKHHQVTFLHVYHHTTVCIVIWFFTKYLLVEQSVFFIYINCIVHTVMYSFYLLAALGPKYAKYLWWKKYLTMLQLTQFFIMMLYLISTIVIKSNLVKLATYIYLVYAGSFIVLFHNFFVNTYSKKRK